MLSMFLESYTAFNVLPFNDSYTETRISFGSVNIQTRSLVNSLTLTTIEIKNSTAP